MRTADEIQDMMNMKISEAHKRITGFKPSNGQQYETLKKTLEWVLNGGGYY